MNNEFLTTMLFSQRFNTPNASGLDKTCKFRIIQLDGMEVYRRLMGKEKEGYWRDYYRNSWNRDYRYLRKLPVTPNTK